MIGQTASEFLRLYPSANILVATERDFEKSRRKQFISRIATGDYDCIIMSHSQFEKIPISPERKEAMIRKQIEEIAHAIDEMKSQNSERWTIKQMESQKKRLEEQIKKMTSEERKDDLITFEELGIDSIMVDEAHAFKNLAIFSKMNVSGITGTGSQRAMDMFLKCEYINELNGGRGIVFATGTPIITGYLRSQMPILRCLCRTASQDYVVMFCFFGVRLIRICKIIYINTIILGIPNRFISSATIMLNIAYNEV